METRLTKKRRLWVVLLTARANKKWASWKDLRIIASKGYISRLLKTFENDGLLETRSHQGFLLYRASEKGLQGFQNLGTLPRGTQRRHERTHDVAVTLVPNDQMVDVQSAWMEHVRVSIKVDMHTAGLMRAKSTPPGAHDRAQQYSFSNRDFAITISRRGACMLVLKELQWSKTFPDWLQACGLSAATMSNVLGQVTLQLPESFRRVEMPVLHREIKSRNVRFVVRTRAGEDWVESNINYSTDVDLESLGTGILVDNWVAMLAATQHNSVAVLQALQQQINDLVKKTEELRKEKEEKERKKEADYYG